MRFASALAAALAVLAGLAACSDDPCDGVAGTCVTLHVTSPQVTRIDHLEVDLLAGTFHATATTSSGGATSLPLDTAVELALPGDLDLGIVAAGLLDGSAVGTGAARLAVADDQHVTAQLELLPPATCTDGTLYCGSDSVAGSTDTLYACEAADAPSARGVCAAGCLVRPGKADECAGSGGACVDTGLYCGGDKVEGDPQSLYRCTAGAGVFVMTCPTGCALGSPGHDDACD
nr:hypothetical protein [Kofleriaceae bacterium]